MAIPRVPMYAGFGILATNYPFFIIIGISRVPHDQLFIRRDIRLSVEKYLFTIFPGGGTDEPMITSRAVIPLLIIMSIPFRLASASECRITVTISPGIPLARDAVAAYLPGSATLPDDFDEAEVVVYHFSRGVERLTLDDEGSLEESLSSGRAECLVKMKRNRKLVRVLFIDARGRSTREILDNLSKALARALGKL